MDRKAWIVIIICAIGMAVNWHFSQLNLQAQAEIAKQAAAAKAAAQPEAPATASKDAASITATPPGTTPPAATASQPEQTHRLTIGSVTYEFSTLGGGIKTATLADHDGVILNQYAKSLTRHEPVGALRREATALDSTTYQITAKDDTSVTLEGTTTDGLKIKKVFSASTGETSDPHLLNLEITLSNSGTNPFQSSELYLYTGTAASLSPDELLKPGFFWNNAGDADTKDSNAFAGGWFSEEKTEFRESYTRLRFGGVMSRFFATIVSHTATPDEPGKLWASRFLIDHSKDKFSTLKASASDFAVEAAISLPPIDLAPGANVTKKYEIFLGPKEYQRLKAIEGQRSFVMFYGWFTPISKLLTNIMNWFHGLSGNWGIAIILMTLLIRIVIWPLQAKSQYAMKRMGLVAPLMKELQEKYKDDPAKQQQEMMKLYRDYGVNPLGGCLPMFLQIPIFFGFFRVLQNAAELRGQDFLWVTDLSMPDTVTQWAGFDVNPLPIIMGITMFLQMKVTPQPATADKMQQRIFMLMPFMFLFFCYSFASALALYWTTQNIFSIFQTYIMKLYMPEPKLQKVERKPKAGPPPKNPFFNPMGNKSDEAPKDKKNKPPRLGG
jgi:YidC/Oxa1 family membrane protein insertase